MAKEEQRNENRSNRRRLVAAGVVGAAALLAIGGFVAANMADSRQPDTGEPEALATAGVAAQPVTGRTSAEMSPPAVKPTPSPSPSPSRQLSRRERVAEARVSLSAAGVDLKRAITPAPGLPKGPVDVTNKGTLAKGGTMRVVTAGYDLSGQRELLWAADKGERVGQARCTQNLRFSNAAEPHDFPTVLLCWRTSATKSVITVAVAKSGRPEKADSITEINRQWAKLG